MNTLAFAIQMETDGEKYYERQAEKSSGTALQRAFLLLAKAEYKHAELLRRVSTQDNSVLDEISLAEHPSIFIDMADYKRTAEVLPGQLEIYTLALEMEQKSIDLYQSMLVEAKDELTVTLMKFLIKQEQDHYVLFEELTVMLRRPREWVEDAEFGVREDY